MLRKGIIILLIALIALAAAYAAIGYVMYNRLADVSGGCVQHAANRPDYFTNEAGGWEGFDFSPYFMPVTYEAVRFPSREPGLTLAGWYVEADPAAPAVILVHGLRACKSAFQVLTPAGMLWHAGFNVLLVDLRDAGQSDYEDGRSALGNEEHLDALGAWDWLIAEKGIPAERIGMVGDSLGAATVLIAFAQEPRLAAAFVDSPFSNLPQIIDEELARNNLPSLLYPAGIVIARLASGDDLLAYDPRDAVRQAGDRPLFILHGTADTRVGVHHSQQLAALAEEVGAANVTVWIIDGVEHVEAAAVRTAEYEQRLTTFFGQALGQGE